MSSLCVHVTYAKAARVVLAFLPSIRKNFPTTSLHKKNATSASSFKGVQSAVTKTARRTEPSRQSPAHRRSHLDLTPRSSPSASPTSSLVHSVWLYSFVTPFGSYFVLQLRNVHLLLPLIIISTSEARRCHSFTQQAHLELVHQGLQSTLRTHLQPIAFSMNHHDAFAAANNIPLHCNICPKKPDFSDVSHLLTHVASKGHLSHFYKMKVRASTDPASKRFVDEYDEWYEEWNVQDLMRERMSQKERKKSGAISGNVTRRASAG